uniref:Uncharacterized protein LOC108043089 n=1 Tax=Drosophila rhopaloa TaxID=1041015 RepID=A0A6P4EKM4_DRORH
MLYEPNMAAKSNVLTIGTDDFEHSDRTKTGIPKIRKEFLDSELENHLQKILLDDRKPFPTVYADKSVETFSAKETKKNGQQYYEFGPGDKINGWMINGPTFEPKGVLKRVKNRISKGFWITENVVKYPKDSRNFIIQTVSNALDEESSAIYHYLCYLNENTKRK